MSLKICKQCRSEKSNFGLSFSKDKTKSWERAICKDCQKENRKDYSKKNRKVLNVKMAEYRSNNQDKIAISKKKYYENNKEKVLAGVKKYVIGNCDKVADYNKEYRNKNQKKIHQRMKQYFQLHKDEILAKQKEKYRSEPSTRIRKILSSKIRIVLLSNGLKKNSSFLKHLPYSIQDLKVHLEEQFEPWMTWDNYGVYRKDVWNDNDHATWTWQIDHIIPHSNFQYSSMEEQSFKDCWALNNLRPLSAKQNLIDSNRKSRLGSHE